MNNLEIHTAIFRRFPERSTKKKTLGNVVKKYFDNSYKNVVSLLVEEENISLEELKKIDSRN